MGWHKMITLVVPAGLAVPVGLVDRVVPAVPVDLVR